MTLLAIDWASVGIKTAQFILSFSILVVLHELGHFIPARWFKCRVEKFYLFFNPWFSIYKKKIGETEYGIGWIPFGGYVKISGMIDESMDKEQLKQPAQEWEFRAKPAWQRLIIMVGGVVVNIVLALVLFIMIMYVWGEEYLPAKNVKFGIVADSLGKNMGLKDGDIIYKVGDKEVKNALTVASSIILEEPKNITIERDGQIIQLEIPEPLINDLNKNKLNNFISIRIPFIISGFNTSSNAEKAGVKINDRVLAMDSVETPFYNNGVSYVKSHANNSIKLKVARGTDTLYIPVPVNEKGAIGVSVETDLQKLGFKVENKNYTFFEAIPVGISRSWEMLGKYMTGMRQLVTGKVNANDSLGSVISIGNTFPGVWNWELFWKLTAIFSIILAFMNILPIPGLDGGHALFTLYEMVSGRKPSDKFMEYAQMAGMVLLLGLMAYALGLDFWRIFK